MNKKENFNIPKEVSRVTETLQNAGFEAYLVGGCVRELLRGEEPKDWDITTNAHPEDIIKLFDNLHRLPHWVTILALPLIPLWFLEELILELYVRVRVMYWLKTHEHNYSKSINPKWIYLKEIEKGSKKW